MYGLLIAASFAVAKEPALAPQATWQVSYIDSMCVVARQFGSSSSPVAIAIKTIPLSRRIEMNLQTKGDSHDEEIGKGHLLLGPSGTKIEVGFWSVVRPRPFERLTRYFVANAADKARIATSNMLTLKSGRSTNVTLAVEGMALAILSLDQCSRDAAVRWGADAQVLGGATADAEPLESPAAWYPSSGYPKAARQARIAGPTTMLWKIDAAGRVVACKVVGQSGSAALDTAGCAAVQHQIRFRPAKDKDGKPIASYTSQRVNWHIPFGGKRLPTAARDPNSPFYGLK